MFFFSHQTDRLNSFILTDFSCSLSNVEKITSTILPMESNIFSSPAFSALFELILSHNARIAPSNKLKNSSKMQVQNCGTYSFNITKETCALSSHYLNSLFPLAMRSRLATAPKMRLHCPCRRLMKSSSRLRPALTSGWRQAIVR